MKAPREPKDEIIENLRIVREAYASRFNYDIAALFDHARERTQQSEERVVKRQPKYVEGAAAKP